MWSHLTTKSFLILHLGHESQFCFLVTPDMLSHGAVCVMASSMSPSHKGQLYSFELQRHQKLLFSVASQMLSFFLFYGLLISNLTS